MYSVFSCSCFMFMFLFFVFINGKWVLGKFGLDALEIFSSLEDAQSKGLVTVRAGQFAPLVESGKNADRSSFLIISASY